MKSKSKLFSLGLALMLLCTLAPQALAAEQTIYLDGYSGTHFGAVESTAEKSQLSLQGTDLKPYGTVTYSDQLEYVEGQEEPQPFRSPVYYTESPVTLTLIAGTELGKPTSGINADGSSWVSLPIFDLRVDAMSFDSEKKFYSLKQEHVAYFDGTVARENEDESTLTKLGTIQEYYEGKLGDTQNYTPYFCKGATVTLSEPGIYRVEAYLQALAGGCEVYIWIGEGNDASAETPAAPVFTDVPEGAYYADAVKWAVENNITAGKTATTFAPGETCTTAHILTFLWRANGSPEPTIDNPFTDVKESDYFYKAALWAHEKKLVSGTAFAASTPCTRGQTMLYLYLLAGSPKAEPSTFTDVAADSVYSQAISWAVTQGITTGKTETTFAPDETCTRGHIVTFLYRAMGK